MILANQGLVSPLPATMAGVSRLLGTFSPGEGIGTVGKATISPMGNWVADDGPGSASSLHMGDSRV